MMLWRDVFVIFVMMSLYMSWMFVCSGEMGGFREMRLIRCFLWGCIWVSFLINVGFLGGWRVR